ncbi:MAG: hypothetical protein GY861_25075 [bacterium]|nr:hypothetical protein [bacterium]
MPNVTVSEASNGKYNVLVNYIQEGVSYNSKELAEQEAQKLRDKYQTFVKS